MALYSRIAAAPCILQLGSTLVILHSYKASDDDGAAMIMDHRNHEKRLDNDDSDECSYKCPARDEDVSNIRTRFVAVTKKVRNGPRKFGEAVGWKVGIEPLIDIDVPVSDTHLSCIESLIMMKKKKMKFVSQTDERCRSPPKSPPPSVTVTHI